MPPITLPNWPTRLDTLDDLLDFIDATSTPSLAFSEFDLDFYPPVHGSYAGDESAYTDIDGNPYDFYVYGMAASAVAYGEQGRHVAVTGPTEGLPRADRIFRAQLRTLALPVKRDDELDYDENRKIMVTPASDAVRHTGEGGTYIDLKISRGCNLWEVNDDKDSLTRSVPLDPRYFGVKEGSWVLAFGTLHKIESLAFEYRYYQFSISDLRVLEFDHPSQVPPSVTPGTAGGGSQNTQSVDAQSLDNLSEVATATAAESSSARDAVADHAVKEPSEPPSDTDAASGGNETSFEFVIASKSVEDTAVGVQDNALSDGSTLSDTSTSDPIALPAKRRSSRKAAASGSAKKRSKTSAK
ncbi:hypothetical protein DFH06DRAFT_1149543 [Mycena polygramma]|nr:hypothetical protein DFH06DRAFT_1149543 [Mycena polygramma]